MERNTATIKFCIPSPYSAQMRCFPPKRILKTNVAVLQRSRIVLEIAAAKQSRPSFVAGSRTYSVTCGYIRGPPEDVGIFPDNSVIGQSPRLFMKYPNHPGSNFMGRAASPHLPERVY
ncbi:hypothetical protein EVAR_73513_1, partial [Eumeta japonica]